MSEKSEKKSEAAAPAAPAAKGGKEGAPGLLGRLPVLLGGVMIIEAVVLFGGFKFLGSKPPTVTADTIAAAEGGGEGHEGKSAVKGKTSEVQVVDFKALNRTSGRTFLYDVSIFVVAKSSDEERIKDIFKDRKALIEDRIRTIIAESDPEKLGGGAEPGLETLRRQIKYQLDLMVGENMIEEVLVPRCIPFRTDY